MIKAEKLQASKTALLSMEMVLLTFLMVVNIISVFGYATFGLNPELLNRWSWAPVIFSHSYTFFARLQIIIAFLALAAFLSKKELNHRWHRELTAVFIISLLMELGGTTFGIPFGKYEYTDLLGWKLAGKVPFLIPVSWFFMAMAAYAITYLAGRNMQLKNKKAAVFRIFTGSLLLTAWDLTLDPAMSRLSPFWLWEDQGIYYGTPLINLFGWFFTGILIMSAFEVLKTYNSFNNYRQKDFTWIIAFYGANLFLPFGMVIFSGLWLPVGLTLGVFAMIWLFVRTGRGVKA